MAKGKTIKLNHKSLGEIAITVDAEDVGLFKENKAHVATFDVRGATPRVRFDSIEGRPIASRVILEKHGMLDYSKNVFYKNGNWKNLTKANLIQK